MGFNKICKDIKTLKIQGAENVAIAGVKALKLGHDKKSIKKLIGLRPTEPCLRNAVRLAELNNFRNLDRILKHFEEAQGIITKIGSKKIKDNSTIFTHCHSSTVVNILKEARKTKKFKVYVTETRPLFQGRITAIELSKLKIPVTMFVDSAARVALKKSDIALFGCDAITTEKIYNKIGSEMFAEIANKFDIPLYVCTDSWKFDPKSIYGIEEHIEIREAKEIWKNPPKGVEIKNISFDKINPALVAGIISELGCLNLNLFIEKVLDQYPWIQGER